MEITINIDQSKKEAKALIKYLQSLPFVDIKQKATHEKFASDSKALDFVNKWTGFLKNQETDDVRFDYLMEKYK